MSIFGAGRYAPSPSGDLHLGNLRTAMLAWLFARSSGREFRVRIEDLDRQRDAGVAPYQLDDLAAMGIDWDGEVVVQTHRTHAYDAAIAQLMGRGLVYECTCSRREIQEAPTAPHTPPGAYPGTCRDRTPSEREAARAQISPRVPALRLRAPEPGQHEGFLTFSDVVLGEVPGSIDDLVLRRGDGMIAYNLAVVVDDAAMGIDQVARGDDLASSTHRQILLQQLLGLPTPEYAHVPLVFGPSGARLAKRDGAVTLAQVRAAGVSSMRLRSVLAESLGLATAGEEVSMLQLLDRFDQAKLPREPWVWPGLEAISSVHELRARAHGR